MPLSENITERAGVLIGAPALLTWTRFVSQPLLPLHVRLALSNYLDFEIVTKLYTL